MILDIYSRYVPGWMIAERQAASLAQVLIAETCEKQKIQREQLTHHADRGEDLEDQLHGRHSLSGCAYFLAAENC